MRSFRRGDTNADGRINLSDALETLGALFSGQPLACLDAADIDDGGGVNVTDVLLLLDYLFRRGAPPAPPFPDVGSDPTADALECRE